MIDVLKGTHCWAIIFMSIKERQEIEEFAGNVCEAGKKIIKRERRLPIECGGSDAQSHFENGGHRKPSERRC